MKFNTKKAQVKQVERNKEIVEMKDGGKTLMEIGKVYRLTKQRVHQIIVKGQDEEVEKVKIK